jgi:hypothetical protein
LKIAYINNAINLRGFADFRKIEQALDNIQSIYFLPDHNNKWALADKFYAYFPCKEFYVGRDWRFGGYDERIYDIPNFTSTYSIVSDTHFNIIQELIFGKGLILNSFTALGFNIFLIKPYYSNSILSNYKVSYRNTYLGHGFISHGCQ